MIVHEPFWNPAAKVADIVLPTTTTLERNDIQAADMSRYYVAMRKVLDPVGRSRNDFDIFAELSDRLGFGVAYSEGRDQISWFRHMYEGARTAASELNYLVPCFDEFWLNGLNIRNLLECVPLLAEFRHDPGRDPLKTPSGKIEIFRMRSAPSAMRTVRHILHGSNLLNGWAAPKHAGSNSSVV